MAKKIEGHKGWSRWDNHLRFKPNARLTECNAQWVAFCSPRRHRRCVKEGKCCDPTIHTPADRDAVLKENGVKPKGRAYMSTGYRSKKENADIEHDWREVDKIRKRWLKECREITVTMEER